MLVKSQGSAPKDKNTAGAGDVVFGGGPPRANEMER